MRKTIPTWADELLDQVCKDEGRSRKPKVHWTNSTVRQSSRGTYYPHNRLIIVRAGMNGNDHKQVFLHEICHWLHHRNPKRVYFYGERRKKRSVHNKRFYLKLNELLKRYDCYTEAYRKREAKYMKRSVNYL